MSEINLFSKTGSFAEDKDVARTIRIKEILPQVSQKEEVILNFEGVESVTQSFIHALISDLIRKYGSGVLDILVFKHCNENIKTIITIVVEYMQESL